MSIPTPGYYPDPSIPGYIRFWNGSAWVPGTSRPAPPPGEETGLPPGVAAAPAPVPLPPAALPPAPPPAPRVPAVDESGPMYLDEDPYAPVAEHGVPVAESGVPAAPAAPAPGAGPAPAPAPDSARAWNADSGRQSGFGADRPRISWGAPELPPAPAPAPGAATVSGPGTASPAVPPARAAAPAPAPASAQAAGGPLPWPQQVRDLARQDPSRSGPPVPWKPVAHDPFLAAAQQQARPAALGKRLVARLIDSVVVAAVVSIAAVPLGSAAYNHIQDKMDQARRTGETVTVWLVDGTTGVQFGIIAAVVLVTGLLYEVLPTVRWGRTLGKKLLGLRVLDIESQYEPDFGPALRRWLTRTVLDALVIGVVGLAWCVVDRPWRQCWHDKAARTFVAKSG